MKLLDSIEPNLFSSVNSMTQTSQQFDQYFDILKTSLVSDQTADVQMEWVYS